jgi:CSLREA domain-containing protein
MPGFRRSSLVTTLALVLIAVLAPPGHAVPMTFVVNSTNDPGTGVCDTTECTLREAIVAANANVGADSIHFNTNGTGVHTITPSTALPSITDQVTIDGYTQPGSSPNTLATGNDAVLKVELNGHNAGSSTGLFFAAGSSFSVMRGLVIRDFGGNAIVAGSLVTRLEGFTFEGNFIGTDVSGTKPGPNLRAIRMFDIDDSNIGGEEPETRNILSASIDDGISLGGNGNRIEGNYIGTAGDGVSPLGNAGAGVHVNGSDNEIGGFDGDPNDSDSERNVIAFNGQPLEAQFRDGVFIENGTGNAIRSNSIFGNGGRGIALGQTRAKNDSGDADTGQNTLQNFPVLTKATTKAGITKIKGSLSTLPPGTYIMEFYSNPRQYKKQGETVFLADFDVVMPPEGRVNFVLSPSFPVDVGRFVTATATRSTTGDTSEFSAPIKVVRP